VAPIISRFLSSQDCLGMSMKKLRISPAARLTAAHDNKTWSPSTAMSEAACAQNALAKKLASAAEAAAATAAAEAAQRRQEAVRVVQQRQQQVAALQQRQQAAEARTRKQVDKSSSKRTAEVAMPAHCPKSTKTDDNTCSECKTRVEGMSEMAEPETAARLVPEVDTLDPAAPRQKQQHHDLSAFSPAAPARRSEPEKLSQHEAWWRRPLQGGAQTPSGVPHACRGGTLGVQQNFLAYSS
jgi:hypothetical protein